MRFLLTLILVALATPAAGQISAGIPMRRVPRTGKWARIHSVWLAFAAALSLPGEALAGWGDDWGAMMWNEAVALPTLGTVGLTLLAMGLAATAAWALRQRRRALGLTLTLVLLVIPLAVVAGTLVVPNTFVNGTMADADEVNANFDAVETEVNDNDTRLATLEGAASVTFKGFSAYFSAAKFISSSGTPGALTGTWSQVEFDAEKFDPQNDYDTVDYRFTPQVAGFYSVSAALWFQADGMFGRGIAIFKNGSVVNLPSAYAQAVTDGNYNRRSITRIVEMNGTSDYLEIYAYQTSGGTTAMYPDGCFFSAHFIGE